MDTKKAIIFLLWAVSTITYAFSGGDGTPENPYQISTRADLEAVNNDLAASYVLMNDIDLSGVTYNRAVIAPNLGDMWGFEGTQFSGKFDGNGFAIYNLTIDGGMDGCYIGLFGFVRYVGEYPDFQYLPEIKNLGLINCNITGNSAVGGLVGYNSYGNISNCYFAGEVNGLSLVGGLVGYNEAGSISNCHSVGVVTGSSTHIGGLVGNNTGGVISYSYSTADVVGAEFVAPDGASEGESESNWVGGFVGENVGDIYDCYATGDVTGGNMVGGIAGGNIELIYNCYTTGTVRGYDSVGAFTGHNAGTIESSFWNTETSGQTVGIMYDFLGSVSGLTTEQMKISDTFNVAGWDYSLIWKQIDGSYPIFQWQNFAADFNDDDLVDIDDLLLFTAYWMDTDNGLIADINCDGIVNFLDYVTLASQW